MRASHCSPHDSPTSILPYANTSLKMSPPCARTPRGSGACLPLDAARVYLSSGALRSLTRRMTRPRLRVASQDPEAKEGHARARSTWPIRVPRPAILREHVTRCHSRRPRPPRDADELEGPSAVYRSFRLSANGSAPAMGGSTAGRARKTILAPPFVDRKSTRLNSSHSGESRMPSSA